MRTILTSFDFMQNFDFILTYKIYQNRLLNTWAYDLKPIWGGTKFLPEKFVTAMTSPKKKKRSSPVSLHLFHHFWPKYATKRVSKQVLTFFFFFWRCYCSDKFFGKNVRTLTQIARKIKSCPKFLQPGGASAPPDPPLRTPMPEHLKQTLVDV